MSWRRFLILVRGLSPNSATIAALRLGDVARRETESVMRTPEEAQRAFVRTFGLRQVKGGKS